MKIRICAVLLLCVMAADTRSQQYAPALPGYRFSFPRDHFDHPEYQTEWWYYTGNLLSRDGHRFGFELTFFRQGVSRQPDASPWYVHDLYMAHLALSDVSGHRYYATERLNRAGPGLAGIDASTETVWNGNWKTVIAPRTHHLQGTANNFSFELDARPEKPPVIQGENGVSQKAEGIGHASHYVSFTRMASTGKLTLNGKAYSVQGDTWMDHEFFTDSLGTEVGWDWLSIQLDDHSELMLYRLRHKDGSVDPYSSGTYIDAQGRTRHLALQDFQLEPAATTWRSQQTGAAYPTLWTVTLPELKLRLTISTPLQDQEFVSRVGPSYWEGAIDITGQHDGTPVQGSGYLEMTGYARGSSTLLTGSPR